MIESVDQIPTSSRRLIEPHDLEPWRKAYNDAQDAGASHGTAMLKGFAAVRPERQVVAKVKLELFSKDNAAQVFYAWASVIEKDGVEVVDHDGDSWSESEMEATAWAFCAAGGAHGNRHASIAEGSELVGSLPFTKDLQQALGVELDRVGWLLGFRVADAALWSDIDSGVLPMVSIGASGFREAVQ